MEDEFNVYIGEGGQYDGYIFVGYRSCLLTFYLGIYAQVFTKEGLNDIGVNPVIIGQL